MIGPDLNSDPIPRIEAALGRVLKGFPFATTETPVADIRDGGIVEQRGSRTMRSPVFLVYLGTALFAALAMAFPFAMNECQLNSSQVAIQK